MTERLTVHNKTGWALKLNDPQNEFEAKQQLMSKFKLACEKLGKLEDILEKYGIESVEELDDFFANYKVSSFLTEDRIKEIAVNEQRKVFQSMIKEITEKECNQLYTELNAWKRACELACDAMTKLGGDDCCGCRLNKEMCKICDNKKGLIDYFYQQAKKEGSDE